MLSVSVLEARIQQLQSDIVLDVKQAKVEFVKAPSSGRGLSSSRGPRTTPPEKAGTPKSQQTLGKEKSQPSRWIEKLTREKKTKLQKHKHLQQKIQKDVKEKPTAKYTGSNTDSSRPSTSHKTISTNKKSRSRMKLSDEIRAAVSPTAVSTSGSTTAAAARTVVMSHKLSKVKQKESRRKAVPSETVAHAPARAEELAEVEALERISQQMGKSSPSSDQGHLQEDKDGGTCGDIRSSICSYLEACVFAGDIERAHSFLLSQHRVLRRRKHLNTSVYNIMMRVWAKKVSRKHFENVFGFGVYTV